MAVQVEEIEILVKANIKDALAGMTQLRSELKKVLSAQLPNIQAQLTPAKQLLDQYGNVIYSSAKKAQTATQSTGDAIQKNAQIAKQAANAEKAALESVAKERERINRLVEEQYHAEQAARAVEAEQAAAALPKEAEFSPYAEFPIGKSGGIPLVDPAKLTGWQKFTAKYYAVLDNVKAALNKVGLYGKEDIGAVKDYTDAATTATKKYGKEAESSTNKAKNGFQRVMGIISRMLLLMAVWRIVDALVNGIKTGLKDMAWASDSANAAISRLSTSSLYLKNSLASAVMPIIQSITPAITQMIDKIAELFNWLGMLNARIFGGASTVTVAKKASVDYAGTLGKTAYEARQAAKDQKAAAKAAKEAADANKGSLADFDELKVIQTQKSDSGTSGETPDTASDAGEGMPAYEDMFETKKIPSDLASLGDKIKTELAKWIGYAQPTIDAFNLFVKSLEPLKTFAATGLEDFYNDYLVPLGKWTLGEGLPGLLQIMTRFNLDVNWGAINKGFDDVWRALEPFQEHIGEGILWLVDNALRPLGTWCMNTVVPKILDIIATSIRVIDTAIQDAKGAFIWLWNSFLKPLGEWTGEFVAKDLDLIADALHAVEDVLKGDFPKAAEDGKKALQDLWEIIGVIFGQGGSAIQIKQLGDDVSESTKRAIGAFDALYQNASKDLDMLAWSGETVTKDMADKIENNVNGMADQTIAGFNRQRNDSIKSVQELTDMTGGLTKKESEDIIKNINAGYDGRIKKEQDGQAQIKKILDTASSEHRGLTQDESDQINKIKGQMYDDGVKALTKNQVEQQAIYDNMRVNHTATTAQEAADVVKSSKDATDKVIDDANRKYDETVAAIVRERDETHTISSDQADKLIAAAKKTRDDTVSSAEDQHQKVVEEAKKQSGEHVNEVDWETGQVKTKWQVMWEDVKTKASAGWEKIKKDASDGWDNIRKKFGEGLDWLKGRWSDTWDTVVRNFKIDVNSIIWLFNKIIDGINWIISGLNKIHFNVPDWIPGVGGNEFGINIGSIGHIPTLANGAVLRKSTIANLAEYPGASQDPEIATPQSIMKDTVIDANGPLTVEILNAMSEMTDKLENAISRISMVMEVDGEQLDRHMRPIRQAEDKRIGKPLFDV